MSPHSAAPGTVRKRSASCRHVNPAVAREASPVAAPVDEVAAPVDEVAAPVDEVAAPVDEHDEVAAPVDEHEHTSPAVAAIVGGVDEHAIVVVGLLSSS